MTKQENPSDEPDLLHGVSVSTEDKLSKLIDGSKCAGCPNLAVVLKEAIEIDELRDKATDPEVFSHVESAFEGIEDLDNPNAGLGFVGPDFFIGKKLGPDDNPATGAGDVINSILDVIADRETELLETVKSNIDECLGKVTVNGHDQNTRQVYEITVCSNPIARDESNEGIFPSFVELNPDV